ncbi:hypothetical protein F4819DRAFT_395910 [Hypoxylon fuscum]|nr:hypothetical protein F4819DRAFT_395910 [Hypoxylon fuscum]
MWVLLAVYGTGKVIVCGREGYKNIGLDTLGAYKRRFLGCLCFFIPASLYLFTRLIIIAESLWSLRESCLQEHFELLNGPNFSPPAAKQMPRGAIRCQDKMQLGVLGLKTSCCRTHHLQNTSLRMKHSI